MIGIYKITNPKGKIYIGQSINIENRFKVYKRYNCKGQSKIYESLKKYKHSNHLFEIVIECNIDQLNELERYYQEYYNVLSKNGLNCQYVKTDLKKYMHSDETKSKIGKSNKGKTGRKFVMTEDHKNKIAFANTGKKRFDFSKLVSELNKKKIGSLNTFFGKNHTDETKIKISNANKGKKTGKNHFSSKLVLDKELGIFYDSITEASKIYNYRLSTLNRILNGKLKNKTNLILI